MRPRTDAVEIFSTFIQFMDDRFEVWVSDPRLVRSMEKCCNQKPMVASNALRNGAQGRPEGFWVLLWYQKWQEKESRQALMHLCAYLQEPCYWAAENITQRFVSVQYTLADGFQVAIASLERILSRYDPAYGGSLRTYARTAFGNIIRNQLRQHKTANICSDWGLLRKLSQAQLHRALQQAGFTQTASGILIWKCFKAVCTPSAEQIAERTVRKLKPPSAAQLDSIASRYNQQRVQLSPVLPSINSKEVLESLKRSIRVVRSLLNPKVSSLNQPKYDDGKELMEDLSADNTPMAEMLAAEAYDEQQQKMQAISLVLVDAIAQLDPSAQALLSLYYKQNLTQKDIASQLQIKQYQVSRKLSRARQQLLSSVTKWSQETLHISIDSAVLANVSEVIHEWLQRHYAPLTNAPNVTNPDITHSNMANSALGQP
ncbi:MAG: sigma-70 family RNA polymerase sigma factor [Cyanobacteria bacterium J06581_3]